MTNQQEPNPLIRDVSAQAGLRRRAQGASRAGRKTLRAMATIIPVIAAVLGLIVAVGPFVADVLSSEDATSNQEIDPFTGLPCPEEDGFEGTPSCGPEQQPVQDNDVYVGPTEGAPTEEPPLPDDGYVFEFDDKYCEGSFADQPECEGYDGNDPVGPEFNSDVPYYDPCAPDLEPLQLQPFGFATAVHDMGMEFDAGTEPPTTPPPTTPPVTTPPTTVPKLPPPPHWDEDCYDNDEGQVFDSDVCPEVPGHQDEGIQCPPPPPPPPTAEVSGINSPEWQETCAAIKPSGKMTVLDEPDPYDPASTFCVDPYWVAFALRVYGDEGYAGFEEWATMSDDEVISLMVKMMDDLQLWGTHANQLIDLLTDPSDSGPSSAPVLEA